MEDEDFFEEFRHKDLSGIKKFNFKKAKAAKLQEKTFSALKNSANTEYSVQNESEVRSKKTLESEAPYNSYSPPKGLFKKGETTNNLYSDDKSKMPSQIPIFSPIFNVSTIKSNLSDPLKSPANKFTFKREKSTDSGLISPNKKNILSSFNKGRTDTILDGLYKNTLSNKKEVYLSESQKPRLKLPVKQTEDIDALKPTEISDLSLSLKKNDFKQKSFEGSPSLLSECTKLTSKGTFNISKYFSNENKADTSKNLASHLFPFKKLLESKKCTGVSDVPQKFCPDKIPESFVPNDMKSKAKSNLQSLKPITISNASSTTTNSPIIRPKKFTFKKRPLTSSERLRFEDVFCKNKEEPIRSIKSSNDFESTVDRVSERILALNEEQTENNDILDNNKINQKKKIIDGVQNITIEGKGRKSPNADNVEENIQSVSSSQSLLITDNDYMDDDEFERKFGNLADQFDENVFNSNEEDIPSNRISIESKINTRKTSDHHNTEELLKEISTLNWDDNFFDDEPIQEGFKDRDDDSEEFKGNYEHSEIMLEMLHQKFGLRSFRPHQREVINASLKQHDCFVLMPTGGGKSLCYQLPAVLMPGVTVVVSPLRALISDQVDKLNALDITAAHLCADVLKAQCEQIYMKLSMREPAIKLLYLTPEKISASRVIIDILQSLYQRGKLARFVIDEVHCLSQWGHDFRPDYKELSMLRKNYKDVPIICLTATATKQVEQDVINILNLKKVKRFIRSFNRPNIKYQVIPKTGKGTTGEIANLIKSKFTKKSGIVYCLSRMDCDKLAEKLNELGIKSKPYHAGMNDKVRGVIQREWMQDRFHVIVATIAFGMGIDKPDVRFVIHNSIPKSVEAFYQESGRAGRDGEVSYSYLYYSYSDVARLLKIMQFDRNTNKKTMDAHKENLKQMVSFAENLVDCRRHLQLLHLGEHFDRRICIRNKATTCDNCENIDNYKTMDVTKEAKELCAIVKDLAENVTMLYVADVYRGSKIKKILDRGHNKHPQYGAGASMDRNDVQRVLKELILKHILNDFCMYTGDFPVVYIKTGPKFYQFFNSDNKLFISVCVTKQRKVEVVQAMENGNNKTNDKVNISTTKPSTSGVVRHTVQKQNVAKLQAARKFQLAQLKVQCHEELLEECRRLAMERNLTLSSVMNLSAIKTMSELLPDSKEEMLKIQHVTNANYNKYGEFFLNITRKFRVKHDALLPLTVVSEPVDQKEMKDLSEDEYHSDFYQSSSQETTPRGANRGVKRKGGWGAKKGSYKKRRIPRKKKGKATPPKATSSGWKGKGGKGGGKLNLMPLHFK